VLPIAQMNPNSSRPTAVTACWVSVVPITGNAEWVNPHEPDAQITKMKDGQTHLAHKQEQAVDLDTGAVLAVTLAGGTAHHTQTLGPTLAAANTTLQVVRAQVDASTAAGVAAQVANAVADKGYHSNAVMLALATAGCAATSPSPSAGGGAGPGSRPSGMRCIATAGAFGAGTARRCCGAAGSCWSGRSHMRWRPAGCAARTCDGTRTSSSGSSSTSAG
jgi:hypothetical protein